MQAPTNWRHQSKYRLIATRCQSCQQLHHPPVKACSSCLETKSEKLTQEQLPTIGTIYSYTIVHKPATSFQKSAPYAIGIIQLDNSEIKLTGQVIIHQTEQLKIGAKVKLTHRILHKSPAGLIHYGIKWLPINKSPTKS